MDDSAGCALKKSLALMLAEAKRLHAAAVDDLNQVMGKTLHDDYERLVRIVKERRHMEVEAQALLDEHIHHHNC